jgi:hypothetical protein
MVHQTTALMAGVSPPLLTVNGNNAARFSKYSDPYPPQSTPGSGRFSPQQDVQYLPQQHATGSGRFSPQQDVQYLPQQHAAGAGRFSPSQDAQVQYRNPPEQHMSGSGRFSPHNDIQYPPLQHMISVDRVPVMRDVQYQPPPPRGSEGGGFLPHQDMLRPMDGQDPMRQSMPFSAMSQADAGPSQSHDYHAPGRSHISPSAGGRYSVSPGGATAYQLPPNGDGGRGEATGYYPLGLQ